MSIRPLSPFDLAVPGTSCRALLRATDWSRTSLGPFEAWPRSLKSFVWMVVEMPTPAIIFWGPDQIQLYNDGYGAILGPRHPRCFGAPYRECWADADPVLAPWMQRVLQGEVLEVDRAPFALTRHGFTEEAYFTFTLSPLRDDTGGIGGILQPVVEVTQEVLGERRAETLRSVATSPTAQHAIEVLGENPRDVPFALFYGRGEAGELRLRARCGIASELAPALATPVAANALATRSAVRCEARQLLGGREHVGAWGEATREAFVLPVPRSGDRREAPWAPDAAHGVLAFGVSPRLPFDERYRAFFEAIARELAAGLDVEAARRAEQAQLGRAEAARAEADDERRKLQSIFVKAPVAITILRGPAHVVEMANPLMCAILNREPHELLGRPILEAVPTLAGHGYEAILAEVLETGEAYVGTEWPVPLQRPDDGGLEERYFNFVCDPLVDASGKPVAVFAVASDVTVHVRARQAAEQLAAELDGARRDAEQARDAAQHASRSKDEFLAMLGHELRNPLAPIFTALELLRMRGVDATSARECEVIDRQARHLAGLVEDLLDVSRITSGKIELRRRLLDLSDILAEAVETVSPLLEKRQHELRVEVPPRLVVYGDPARLTQVFANLLTNAAKYTDRGGRLTIEARREGDRFAVEISDTGRGIAPEMLPRLFHLFEQEPQNLDRAQGGLGLGLAIVKSLVTMHGGEVEARSEGTGRGSTFVVRLPAAHQAGALDRREPSTPPGGLRAPPPPDAGAQAILVVDDNEDAAFMLAESLAVAGHTCTVAHDGPRAIELARATHFDAVLLDIGLPAMDGYEVARHIRALPGAAELKLIAITGYGQRSDHERSLAAGFDHHLVKPVPMRTLLELLDPERADQGRAPLPAP